MKFEITNSTQLSDSDLRILEKYDLQVHHHHILYNSYWDLLPNQQIDFTNIEDLIKFADNFGGVLLMKNEIDINPSLE